MERTPTINGQEFKVGLNVYIFRKETVYYSQDNSFQHTAVFKSKIVEINKRTFKVKGLNDSWDRFQFEIVDNKVIPCVNGIQKDSFSYWNRNSIYTLDVVNEDTRYLYLQTKKENPMSMTQIINNFLNDFRLSLKKRKTRDLLSLRMNFYTGWLTGKFGMQYYQVLKDELATREHVPNKKEAKVLRRNNSRH